MVLSLHVRLFCFLSRHSHHGKLPSNSRAGLVMDRCSIISLALKNTFELIDAKTLAICQECQTNLCDIRWAHTAFMNEPLNRRRLELYRQLLSLKLGELDSQMLNLGIVKEPLWKDVEIDWDTEGSRAVIDNEFLLYSLATIAAIQTYIVKKLQFESAFKTTSKTAMLSLHETNTLSGLSPATSLEVPLITMVAIDNTLERQEEMVKSPRRLMSMRCWQTWREQLRIGVMQRYPNMHVRLYIQPFGDRVFHNSTPQRCSIVIWESLSIMAFVIDPSAQEA